jgi:hypothetical protein
MSFWKELEMSPNAILGDNRFSNYVLIKKENNNDDPIFMETMCDLRLLGRITTTEHFSYRR